MAEQRAEDLLARLKELESRRSLWESHWNEVAQYVLPRKQDIWRTVQPGAKKTTQLMDSTGVDSNLKLASHLLGNLCPNDQRWFALRARNPALNELEAVSTWMHEATSRIHEEIAISNYGVEIFELFLDLGCFGTGDLNIEEGEKTTLNFRNWTIRDIFVAENRWGLVDTVFRKFEYTARQAIQHFGVEAVSEDIRKADRAADQRDTKFEFVHIVMPRIDRQAGKIDRLNKPFASIYVELKAKAIISEGGYDEMPHCVPRFTKASGEVYGRSPGMFALPEMKMLNVMCRTTIKGAQKKVDPTMLVSSEANLHPLRAIPGGIMYYDPSPIRGGGKPEPLLTGGDPGLGIDMEELRRQKIERAFFVDLFLMISQSDQRMTATEVIERVEERVTVLGPTLGRLIADLFNPLVHRCLGILGRAGQLPPLPPEMEGQDYDIEYISKLALAMKLMETRAVTNTLAVTAPLLAADPMLMDNIEGDETFRGIARRMGMAPPFIRSIERRDELRALRAEKQQQAEALAAAGQVAEAAGKVGMKVPVGEGV